MMPRAFRTSASMAALASSITFFASACHWAIAVQNIVDDRESTAARRQARLEALLMMETSRAGDKEAHDGGFGRIIKGEDVSPVLY